MLATETRALALDVHTLLAELDVARWRAELEHAVRSKLRSIQLRLERVRNMDGVADGRLSALAASVEQLAAVVSVGVPDASEDPVRLARDWSGFRQRLQPAYEAMANALRALAIHVPTRRPTNYARNLLHGGGALLALVLVQRFLPATALIWVGGALALWAWSMELSRRAFPAVNHVLMAILGRLAHPHEAYRINSATWYCTAMLLLGATGSKTLVLVAIAVLGFADPAAALVGRRYGSIKLVNGRSLQGSLAFFVVASVMAALVLLWTRPDLPVTLGLAMALAGALLAAVAELFSLRVDDNLSVPVAAAAGAGLVATLAGVLS